MPANSLASTVISMRLITLHLGFQLKPEPRPRRLTATGLGAKPDAVAALGACYVFAKMLAQSSIMGQLSSLPPPYPTILRIFWTLRSLHLKTESLLGGGRWGGLCDSPLQHIQYLGLEALGSRTLPLEPKLSFSMAVWGEDRKWLMGRCPGPQLGRTFFSSSSITDDFHLAI